jgi:hypothetical protein
MYFLPNSKQVGMAFSVGFRLQNEAPIDSKMISKNSVLRVQGKVWWIVWIKCTFANFQASKEWPCVLHNLTWQTCFK